MKHSRLSYIVVSLVLSIAPTALAESPKDAPRTQTAATKTDLTAVLEAHEQNIWAALKKKDTAAMAALVEPGAWAIDPSGVASVDDFIKMMPEYEVRGFEMHNVQSKMITKDVYVLTFQTTVDASFKGQPMPSGPWYCSTVYTKRTKGWIPVFHQETLGMPTSPTAAGSGH
jgi:hypothetical protein